MNPIELSWEWFDRTARTMAQDVTVRLAADRMPLDGVIVLGRGGLVLGSRLSHLLQAPLSGTVLMSRFARPSDSTEDPPVEGVLVSPRALRKRGRLLLADNIISEGVTLTLAQEALARAGVQPARLLVCALLARGQHAPDGIIGARVPEAEWYVFPWEMRP